MSAVILDSHKLMYHRSRVEAWLRGERIAPITIDCALTRRCNYNCTYCYSKLQHNTGHELSRTVIRNFLSDAAEIGVKAVSFVSDGESTISPHIYDAIMYGRSQGLDIALGTNGYALKHEKLKEMLHDLTYVRFNISAGDEQRYALIHGVSSDAFTRVCDTIRTCVSLKKEHDLTVTIGMQMVLLPENAQDILPVAQLGKDLGVDYVVVKHCSDDEHNSLGVDYEKYYALSDILKRAESLSTEVFTVKAKWSKLLSKGKKIYTKCYGPPFILQLSGSGLVAPCGFLFNEKYHRFHIGNIAETRFKDIFNSDRYWEIMNYIGSQAFNARTDCGKMCLQHYVNEFLWNIKENHQAIPETDGHIPQHVNFI